MMPSRLRPSPAALFLLILSLGQASARSEEHALAGPYTDPSYLTTVAFGAHSHWLQPWRAWLETVPAARFVDGIGVNLHLHGEDPGIILEHLARHGVRSARIEIGWGGMAWEEDRLATADALKPILLACKAHRLRPLILLNAHQGAPGPMHWFARTLAADAAAGATSVQLSDASDLVIGHSGLCNLSEYWAAEALITAIDGTTLTLSKPLPKALAKAQAIPIATLKHRPFGPAGPDFDDTMAAWLRYVDVVAAFVTETLGTTGGADKGFDLEIWNEMSFGSNVLFINKYYRPARFIYHEDGIYGALVGATARHIVDHEQDFAGVQIDDGFGNTLPWPAAGNEPPRIHAIGKHPYSNRHAFPMDEAPGQRLNAQGKADDFAPAYACSSFPEYFFTALQTETIARDCAPIATDIYGNAHGAHARPGPPCPVWVTEVGFPPNENGITDHARQLALKAKTTARYLAFYLGKGVERIWLFGALEHDDWLGIVADSLGDYAKANHAYPADDAPFTSPAMRVIERMARAMSADLDRDLGATRPLAVSSIADSHDHLVFAGDGSAAHPPLHDRDVLALIPYQVNARRFIIPYYVMTRDVTADLAPEEFTVVLAGIHAADAVVSVYDPLNDRAIPVQVIARAQDRISLRLAACDYPYLLTIQE